MHRDFAYERGKALMERLRKLIPRQMFEVALQAAIGSKIDRAGNHSGHAQERAREMLRRRYLAETKAAREAERRQAPHETCRARRIPQEAFLAVLKVNSDTVEGAFVTTPREPARICRGMSCEAVHSQAPVSGWDSQPRSKQALTRLDHSMLV